MVTQILVKHVIWNLIISSTPVMFEFLSDWLGWCSSHSKLSSIVTQKSDQATLGIPLVDLTYIDLLMLVPYVDKIRITFCYRGYLGFGDNCNIKRQFISQKFCYILGQSQNHDLLSPAQEIAFPKTLKLYNLYSFREYP